MRDFPDPSTAGLLFLGRWRARGAATQAQPKESKVRLMSPAGVEPPATAETSGYRRLAESVFLRSRWRVGVLGESGNVHSPHI